MNKDLYAGQEATLRTLNGRTDWLRVEKEVPQGSLLSPCLFNLYTEHIMRNARLGELQQESRQSGETSTCGYVDDTTLTAGSDVELKILLLRVKEESERACLN